MGVKYFFSFIKDRFPQSISKLDKPLFGIDNLMIDLNGIFHTCAQSVYGTPPIQYYLTYQPRQPTLSQQNDTFEKVWKMILNIVGLAPPLKRLILCIDGVAPFAKQTQQRQRRYKSVKDKIKGEWDSNCITPGTVFMDHLSKFLDFKIRQKLSNEWKGLEVIFSNEKCPQEGEHKIIKWVRRRPLGTKESYCLHGMDADLVMLGLSTGKKNFHILRQNHLNPNEHYHIKLDNLRNDIVKMFMFSPPPQSLPSCDKFYGSESVERGGSVESVERGGSVESVERGGSIESVERGGRAKEHANNIIRDFIFMLFTVGNDFLPHLPAIEILEGGIEILAESYRINSEKYGYLTEVNEIGRSIFRKESFSKFLELLGQYEEKLLNKKANHYVGYDDPILEECKYYWICGDVKEIRIDFEKYKSLYYRRKLNIVPHIGDSILRREGRKELESVRGTNGAPGIGIGEICLEYINGLQWVLDYYTTGITSWKWYYPHYYTVFSSDLSKYVMEYKYISKKDEPLSPFEQLLCVLPPFSSNILPYPLNTLVEEKSPIKKYYPIKFEIDLEGKRNDWEGIAILPFIDVKIIQSQYRKLIDDVSLQAKKRNIVGKSFIYRWEEDNDFYYYKCYYGNFKTKVEILLFDI